MYLLSLILKTMFLLLLNLCRKIRCIMEYSFNNVNVFTIVDFEDDVSTIIESMSENSLHHGVFI